MMTATPLGSTSLDGVAAVTPAGLGGVALETIFRGDVRSVQWDSQDCSSLNSHAEFARAIAGAYDLPPSWSATYITYTSA